MPAVDVRLVDVVKRFGDVHAVDHIDLEVHDGEFFSLLGPSGCGKTTTLRMIGGFEEPTSGLIELQGEDVTWLPPFKRNVNTVFQNYALFPHLTIFENVAFGLRRKGVPDRDVKSRVGEMLELVELPGYERRKPTQISGGQAQRVALARALINRPAVLLLDEPLGALDLKLRKQMQVELKRIQQEVGITFIYVTHDQEEAMTMSDRIAVMNLGRYEQLGDPESLYERPATPFVAGFLGVSNLLPGTVQGKDERYATVKLADDTLIRAPSGLVDGRSDISVGVRPEKIRLREANGTDAPPAGHNTLHGIVRDASYLGVSTQYQVEARGGVRLTVYEQNVERATRSELWAPGEEVVLTWSPDHSFVVTTPDEPSDAVAAACPGGPGGTDRMTERRSPLPVDITRRRFLQGTALAGTAAFLAACGTPPQSSGGAASPSAAASQSASAGASASASASSGATPATSGELRFANWIGYIDISDDKKSFPTIEKFQTETGITVQYADGAVDDNETFFTSDLQAPLQAGQPTEWDLVVLTDWMVARLVRLKWLETIDTSLTPNFVANLNDNLKARSFDPDTNLAAPWQSGMTGIGFDKKKTGDQKSLDVFFDDQFKGKLTYLSEMRDTIGLASIRQGNKPEDLTQEQFDSALADVQKAVKDGIVRQVTGNSYVEDMAGG